MEGHMKKVALAILFFGSLWSKQFKILNETKFPIEIYWKSSGFKTEGRGGTFILDSKKFGFGETYQDNCVNILLVKSLDGKLKAKTKPFCKDSKIIIAFFNKKLKITVQNLALDEMEKSI